MTIDIVKFFQAFVRQMAEIGGINLPKTVSSSLGGHLAETYKKNTIDNWKEAITGMIQGMGGSVVIEEDEDDPDHAIHVTVSYFSDFCPIGGHPMSSRSHMIQDAVCRPYLAGFLRTYFEGKKLTINFTKCIAQDGGKNCCVDLEVD